MKIECFFPKDAVQKKLREIRRLYMRKAWMLRFLSITFSRRGRAVGYRRFPHGLGERSGHRTGLPGFLEEPTEAGASSITIR